jgi:hypothetical protein
MRQSEDRRRPDPEQQLLSVFGEDGVSDLFDAFGDPDGEFAEEPGTSASPDGSGEDAPAAANDGPFPDVPDADDVAAGSPEDPASPPDGFHGTDLVNGAD